MLELRFTFYFANSFFAQHTKAVKRFTLVIERLKMTYLLSYDLVR